MMLGSGVQELKSDTTFFSERNINKQYIIQVVQLFSVGNPGGVGLPY
jgi:hypothetical protein